jgi:hypothetical protein
MIEQNAHLDMRPKFCNRIKQSFKDYDLRQRRPGYSQQFVALKLAYTLCFVFLLETLVSLEIIHSLCGGFTQYILPYRLCRTERTWSYPCRE